MKGEILEKLFDSQAKLRLLKLFLRNPDIKFTSTDIRRRTQVESSMIKRQLIRLHEIGLIRAQANKKAPGGRAFTANRGFVFFNELQNLILQSSPASKEKIKRRIKGLGRVKLAVLSGIFINPEREHMRTDMLIVADDIREKKFANFVRDLEAEAGVELHYTLLTTEEFRYRQSMFDRFLRDILEKPHEVLINQRMMSGV